MADKFRALLVTKDGNRQSVAVTELTDADLMEGDVTVAVEHSTVNYKDGLAIMGKGPIIRKFPLIPGIDLAGKVLCSEDSRFQAGNTVVLLIQLLSPAIELLSFLLHCRVSLSR